MAFPFLSSKVDWKKLSEVPGDSCLLGETVAVYAGEGLRLQAETGPGEEGLKPW